MIAPAENRDFYYYGIVPEKNFRFTFVDCSVAVAKIIAYHSSLDEFSAELLASSIIGSFLLSDLVKQNTKVSLQLSFFENSSLHSILAYSDRKGFLKGTVRFRNEEDMIKESDNLEMLGTLKVFRWQNGECIYQSYITFHAIPFEDNLAKYLQESEQLVSFVKVFVVKENDIWTARGFLLQAVPGVKEEDVNFITEGLTRFKKRHDEIKYSDMNSTIELLKNDLDLESFDILEKGIPEERCDCSKEKIEDVMVTLGKEYLEEVVTEIGFIEFTCEFCNMKYRFDKDEVNRLITRT